jgi:hypothetical protein
MNYIKALLICLPITTLSGCFEAQLNTDKLCEKYPELRCHELNMNDGQCRVPRTDLIWHRKDIMDTPSEHNQIQEFYYVQAYQKCLNLAAQIESIKIDDRKERRVEALLKTYDEEKRIIAEISQSTTPEALYFLWTQGVDGAEERFISLEGTGQLNTAKLQAALASYYTSRDKIKTLKILNTALSLSQYDTLDTSILESLASINHTLKRKEHAYIWAVVAKNMDVAIVSDSNLAALYMFPADKKEALQEIAKDITKAIKNNNYRAKLLPTLKALM